MNKRLHILIVEDNQADVDLIRETLPEKGPVSFRIESVSQLSGALARLKDEGVDLVLLDLGLPDSQGLETFRRLREAAPHIPVIILTVNDDQEVAVAAVREGAQDYLVKGQIGGSLLTRALRYAVERKRAEEALQEFQTRLEERVRERTQALAKSEERFRMMVEEVKDYAIIMLDAEGRIVSWNVGAERIKGYRADEIVGRHFSQFYPREDMESGKPERALANAIAEGRFEEEGWRVRKDGSLFFAGMIITALRDDAGGLRGFTKITRDITERKQAEEALRENQAKLAAALASMTDAVFISDAAGNFVEFNDAFATFHRFRNKAECARKLSEYPDIIEVFMANGEPAPLEMWAVPRALRGETVTNAEYSLRRKDTGETWVGSYNFAPIRDEAGEITGSVVVGRDITEHKRAEEEIRKLNAHLEKRVEERTRELSERTTALESFNQAMIGREARIVELKEEVDRLRAESGKESPAGAPNGEAGEVDSPGSAERRTEEEAPPPASSAIPLPESADMAAPAGRSYRLRWFAALVLLVSLSFTAAAWHAKYSEEMKLAQERFDFRVNNFQAALQGRLMAYQSMLRGGVALFHASDEVTRQAWRTYVEALRIGEEFPGVRGVGFSQRILPAEKEAHLRRIRREGFPGYAVRPEGERPEYTAIIFLEPFDEMNQRAFGYDMFSEPVRRLAMTRARDTGRPALSGKVTLVQEMGKDVQAGFLIYLPVYRHGKALSTPEQRREALAGYVYSPFRMNDFIRGLLAKDAHELEVEIHDGKEAQPETMMYNSATHDHPHRLTRQATIEFGGHRWLLTFTSSPQFESANMPGRSNFILWLGVAISLLLSGIVLFFERLYRQALALAGMTSEIGKANDQLKAEAAKSKGAAEELQRRMAELATANRTMIGREQRIIEMKEEVNALCRELKREPKYPPVWREGAGS